MFDFDVGVMVDPPCYMEDQGERKGGKEAEIKQINENKTDGGDIL